MESEGSKGRDSSYVFFSLLNAVLIVLSNVAFQQYDSYKQEVEHIGQEIDNLGGEYSKFVMIETIIEIKSTLINSQLIMLSQKAMLEEFDHILAREYGLADTVTSAEITGLIERNRVLEDLMREVANTSAYVGYTSPDLKGYDEYVSARTVSLESSKVDYLDKSKVVWKVGLSLILSVFALTLYSFYLSQVKSIEEHELRFVQKIKFATTLQVILGVFVIVATFVDISNANLLPNFLLHSNVLPYLMYLILFATVGLIAMQAAGHFRSTIKKGISKHKA
ncbi:MAG: hypothetical protein V1703_03765 [Candidatus Altiarchaeota archaeon]